MHVFAVQEPFAALIAVISKSVSSVGTWSAKWLLLTLFLDLPTWANTFADSDYDSPYSAGSSFLASTGAAPAPSFTA